MRSRFKEELRDLALLVQIAIAVVLVWVLLLGWSPDCYIARGDSLALDLNGYLQFLREHGVWQNVVYRAGLLGGADLHDVWGSNAYLLLTARLGLLPKEAFNSFIFLTQIALAFFGTRFLERGHFLWNALRAVLIAFSPFIALRFTQGHYGLIMVMAFFFSSFLILYDLKRQRITWTSLAVYAFIALSSFGQQVYQFYLYGLLFGGPFLIAASIHGFPAKGDRVRLIAFALFVIACLFVSAPRIIGQLDYALGPDSNRALTTSNVIYSYTTATFTDWFSSIYWGFELIPTHRGQGLFHETNYPMGPFLVFPLLLVLKKRYSLVVAASVSVFLALTFSMNIEPFSFWLSEIFSPLKGFRVPERAMFPFIVILPWLALKSVDEAYASEAGAIGRKDIVHWSAIVFLALSLGVFHAPQLLREIVGWAAALFCVLLLGVPKVFPAAPRSKVIVCTALLLMGAELSAFEARLLPFQTERQVMKPLDDAKRGILSSAGAELLRPLTRSHFDSDINFVTNKGGVMGISTIEGYSQPTRRFAQLHASLEGKPVNPTAVMFGTFHPGTDFFGVFEKLYNIRYLLLLRENRVVFLTGGFGEAWFSNRIEYVEDFPQLARSLYVDLSKDRLEIVKSDAFAPRWRGSEVFSSACSRTRIDSIDVELGGQKIGIETNNDIPCPLTVSTNFLSRVRAVATSSSGAKTLLAAFPGYGALLSMIVPAQTRRIDIEFPACEPGWSEVVFWSGALFMLASLLLFRRLRKRA